MIGPDALLRHLGKLGREEEPLIGGNRYTLSQVRLAEKIVRDLQSDLERASRKPKLSRRRAFIVILEELYFDTPEYPKELTLERIHRRASQRFEYMNRNTKELTTPTEVHPKDPCTYYEENAHGKARYRAALEHLVNGWHLYFQEPDAEISLKTTYNDVKLC
jgi:FKBP-type peptidyl-prolyl cis-trans isomerase (trigger factor)